MLKYIPYGGFMSKRIWAVLIVLAVCVFGWWWFAVDEAANTVPARKAGKLRVTATGYVPYALARQIGGNKISLSMLVPPGTEPHHFEPTPGSIIAVDGSDLFVYASARIEPWTKDILKGLGSVRALQAGPSEDGQDPHVWMTPYGALSMAENITDALCEADPANAAYYRENLKQFEKEMQGLHAAFKEGLARCQSREMVHVGHLAFGALANAYGLNLQALTGTSHQGEHSVKRLADLVHFIRQNDVKAVFTEEMLSPDLAAAVAGETGVKILPLYTVEEISKQDFDAGKTYGAFMHQNLKNLQEGLQCAAR